MLIWPGTKQSKIDKRDKILNNNFMTLTLFAYRQYY